MLTRLCCFFITKFVALLKVHFGKLRVVPFFRLHANLWRFVYFIVNADLYWSLWIFTEPSIECAEIEVLSPWELVCPGFSNRWFAARPNQINGWEVCNSWTIQFGSIRPIIILYGRSKKQWYMPAKQFVYQSSVEGKARSIRFHSSNCSCSYLKGKESSKKV